MIIEDLQKQFGLDLFEIEKNVLQVNNTTPINVDDIKKYLKKCILITSSDRKYVRNNFGINNIIAKVYFILLDYEDDNLMKKYRKIAKTEIDKDSVIDSYYERPDIASSIDTLYTSEELGRK